MLHALAEFQIDEPQARLNAQQPQAGVDVQYVSAAPLAFRQWDGYSPPPTREFPNQWHVEAATRDRHEQLAMFTVIVPYRTGQQLDWSTQQVEDDSTLGVRVVCGAQSSTVWFPKSGTPATVRVKRE